ncbi:hypothetical protein H9639_14745 [Arthrobacter sp. Sa2CUA1]|uniref:Uncharacterized protein n=1 Tax=Arthrobacter gallicola TaxID=2762225 RepID=A0ABR8UWT3_9MICC|nr:hypothetical protein [Arthrobacter gallicola]MBD7996556.1 hypothetical protein [Arthrobacter gallicola]
MRRPDPRSLGVLAAVIVLAAGSGGTPPPAAPAAGPGVGSPELSAAEIASGQQELVRAVMTGFGSPGWTDVDGTPYTDTPAGPAPRLTPCSADGPGPRPHKLTTTFTGPPPAAAERARDQAQQALKSAGTEMLSALTPGPGAPPETDFTFFGTYAGSTVRYSVNEYRQLLEISSRCSPGLGLAQLKLDFLQ